MALDPAVEPFVPTMSPPKSPRAERAAKVITKRTYGPEDGYSFRVEETFIQRRIKTPPPPVVRKGPRPAPPHLRFLKNTSTQEMKTDAGSIKDPAKPNNTSDTSPLQTTTGNLHAMTECAKDPSPSAMTNNAKTSSPLRANTAPNQPKDRSATAATTCTIPTPRYSSDPDGGVELPPHIDTANARGIVFGGEVDDDKGDNCNDRPEADALLEATNQVTSEGCDSDPLVSALDCCNSS